MPYPISDVFITDTGQHGHTTCSEYSDCERDALSIETKFRGYYPDGDLRYNFLIPDMENIFEGRGWKYDASFTGITRTGDQILFVTFMGNFNFALPSTLQMDMLWSLVHEGIEAGFVDPEYKIYAECQRNGFDRPGKAFFDVIRGWDRWSNESIRWQLVDCYR